MLKSDLCDYCDAYIIAKGIITVADANGNNGINKMLALKNNSLFRSCNQEINNTFKYNSENLGVKVEYSGSCSMTSESLWNYCSDEMDDDVTEKNADNHSADNSKTATSKYFECKKKAIVNTTIDNNTLGTEVFVT